MRCRIRINGHLDSRLSEWPDDLEIAHEVEGADLALRATA